MLVDDVVDQRVAHLLIAQLQEQALPQIAGADAGRIETLDDTEHGLRFLDRQRRFTLEPRDLRILALQEGIQRLHDRFQLTGQEAGLIDITDDLLGDDDLARVETQ